ncbi:MAG: hypothetical protein J0H00_20760 [Burkholderiales bacterium]|nr:hypothetical protein [Burkholderiales bacterium]OJX05281.1 MAG: glycoside hydrolase [Burkholderiales bacterium 70-64]
MADGLDLVLVWHMHQPDYRLAGPGGEPRFVLPWTYLHAIKDYSDMAAHLERHPRMRAVVNFVPVLLDQLEDYAAQCATGALRDPLLQCLAHPDLGALSPAERNALTNACFRSNHETMLRPYPQYLRLHELYRQAAADGETGLMYLSGDYFSELVTWYHLVWCGESERRQRAPIAQLLSKGSGFDLADRRLLLAQIGEILGGLIPRYAALARDGRIELSTTPNTHPLAPLLLDLASARQSQPDALLPHAGAYPGGRTRLAAQIAAARASHARRFGAPPAGMWPAEGAVSDGVVALLGEAGCRWAASSESVLANSLGLAGEAFAAERARHLYRAWRVDGHAPALFFRDEPLSDGIGFEYAKWYGSDAAADFVARLERIAAEAPEGERPLVSVILDGENAWESYPYNGYYFLDHLYEALCNHPTIRTTTFAEWLDGQHAPPAALTALKAGSWVYGTLSTWIGEPEKNRAWDLLCTAKQCFDRAVQGGRLDEAQRTAATAQLARCESSDWFWWFGPHNPRASVETFDRLFRANLARLYTLLGLAPPAILDTPISHGGGSAEQAGTMRRAT